ncbi:hypothetical protein Bca52824_011116 [Brassica carinata]|uniref:Ubiquitin-like domain-containing protein n=1 Tax=Brassica carinata TaxID=52824 RepID=A0A8X8BBH7_BRACI|nr:hypothetical protein Bca52824_011116 [Brassica carinata]
MVQYSILLPDLKAGSCTTTVEDALIETFSVKIQFVQRFELTSAVLVAQVFLQDTREMLDYLSSVTVQLKRSQDSYLFPVSDFNGVFLHSPCRSESGQCSNTAELFWWLKSSSKTLEKCFDYFEFCYRGVSVRVSLFDALALACHNKIRKLQARLLPEQLADDKTAKDYKIEGGSILHLVLALCGGFGLF